MQAGYGWSDVKRDVLLKRKQYDDETCTSKLPSDSKVIYIYPHIFYTFYIKYTSLTGFFFVHNEFENEFKIMYLYSKLVTSTWQYFSYRNEQIKLQPKSWMLSKWRKGVLKAAAGLHTALQVLTLRYKNYQHSHFLLLLMLLINSTMALFRL